VTGLPDTSLRGFADRLVVLSLERYLADATCLSSGRLRRLTGRSPFADRPDDAPPTWPMRFGTWAHEALLEADVYAARLARRAMAEERAAPPAIGGTNADAPVAAPGFDDPPDDLDLLSVDAIVHTVRRLPGVAAQLDRALKERVLVRRDPASGVWVRIRPDGLDLADGVLIEFKTVEKLGGRNDFMAHALRMGYDVQAGLYLHLLEGHLGRTLDLRFLVAERSAPFDALVIDLPRALAASFRMEAARLLAGVAGDARLAAYR
jgi:hypothetical protein